VGACSRPHRVAASLDPARAQQRRQPPWRQLTAAAATRGARRQAAGAGAQGMACPAARLKGRDGGLEGG